MTDFLTSLLFNTAYAADSMSVAPNPAPGFGGFNLVMMFVIFIGFMYFAVWRPQAKRAKEQRELLNSLAKGDEVVTIGGILGRVTKVSDNYVTLALADNVEIMMQKSAVASALPKGTMKAL